MKRWWLWALLLNLAFFGAWTLREELRLRGAQAFLLETEGADPRDLFAGQYLALAFPVARLGAGDGLSALRDGARVAVRLDAAGTTRVAGKDWPLRRAGSRVSLDEVDAAAYPASAGWALGTVERGRVAFGIERYYFNEDREAELRKLVPGRVFALVSLSPDGHLRIRQLVQ